MENFLGKTPFCAKSFMEKAQLKKSKHQNTTFNGIMWSILYSIRLYTTYGLKLEYIRLL